MLLEASIEEAKLHVSTQRLLSRRISRLEKEFEQIEIAERLSLIRRIYKIRKSAGLEAFTTEVEKIFAAMKSDQVNKPQPLDTTPTGFLEEADCLSVRTFFGQTIKLRKD